MFFLTHIFLPFKRCRHFRLYSIRLLFDVSLLAKDFIFYTEEFFDTKFLLRKKGRQGKRIDGRKLFSRPAQNSLKINLVFWDHDIQGHSTLKLGL